MTEKYFIICNYSEGGGGRISKSFNTKEEAISYVKQECCFWHVEIIKGEIVWQG